jgi:hypothetical protein
VALGSRTFSRFRPPMDAQGQRTHAARTHRAPTTGPSRIARKLHVMERCSAPTISTPSHELSARAGLARLAGVVGHAYVR